MNPPASSLTPIKQKKDNWVANDWRDRSLVHPTPERINDEIRIPLNNSPELAQWYLERGKEQSSNGTAWLMFIGPIGVIAIGIGVMLILSPIFWPKGAVGGVLIGVIAVIFGVAIIRGGLTTRGDGRRKVAIGEAMNEVAGRKNYVRPRGYAGTQFMRGWDNGPDTRFFPVRDYPPVRPHWSEELAPDPKSTD